MSSQTVTPNSEAAILSRLIQAKDEMSHEAARCLLSIDFSAGDLARMNFLAQRAQDGQLSEVEAAELDSYTHVGHVGNLLTILKSKARPHLKASSRVTLNQ